MSKKRGSAWWSPFGRRARHRADGHQDFADMGTALGLEATLETAAPRSIAVPAAAGAGAADTAHHTTAERLNARLNRRSVR